MKDIAENNSLTKIIVLSGFGATICVLIMFAIFLFTKIGQDPLQYVHGIQEYKAILENSPNILRATIGIDNVFIVLYSTLFVCVGSLLWDRVSSKLILGMGIGFMLSTAILDVFENIHFYTMISASQNALPITAVQMELQVWESMVKFHISYIGLFFLGLSLPRQTILEKILCFSLIFVQAPIGILIYSAPQSFALPLVMARFAFFMFSLLATALVFRWRKYD